MPRTARVAAAPAPVVVSADPVFSAIEAHREALSEFTAEVHYAVKKRRGFCGPEWYRAARDAYDAATSAFVVGPITTAAGLRAFTTHVAGLRAYGRVDAGAPFSYAIEVWHLSDAMATVSETLARLLSADASALAH